MKDLYTIKVSQNENDSLPRHLATYVDEPLSRLPQIYKQEISQYLTVVSLILTITKE